MASVTFDTVVGGDGSTVTDDDDPGTGLGNGGHLIRTVPMFQQIVNIALWIKNTAAGYVLAAATSAANALTSEQNALDSKNAAATSVTQVNTLGAATGLQTTGAVVVTSTATPPKTGQVLKATSATTATWQADAATSNLKLFYLSGK